MNTITLNVASDTTYARGKERRTVTFPNGDSQDWTVAQLRRRGYDYSGELVAQVSDDLNENGQHVLTYPSGWRSRWSPETLERRSTVVETTSGSVGEAPTDEVAAEAPDEPVTIQVEDFDVDATPDEESKGEGVDFTTEVNTEVEVEVEEIDAAGFLRELFGIGSNDAGEELFSIVLPSGIRLTVTRD